jgi:hypothetical protein
MSSELEARIRARAYQIWQDDPSPGDNAERHWEEARQQIEAEGDGTQAGIAADQSSDREKGGRPAPEEVLQEVPVTPLPTAPVAGDPRRTR